MAKILVVTGSLTQPRVQRRIRSFSQAGHQVTVYGFDRMLQKANKFIPEDVEIHFLGMLTGAGVNLKRLLLMFKAFGTLKNATRQKSYDVIYCFSFDSALIASFLGQRCIHFYEISDLMFSGQHAGLLSKIFCRLENRILIKFDTIVLTSPWFGDELKRRVPEVNNKLFVIENKIPEEIAERFQRPAQPLKIDKSRPVRIGYIGLVKYVDCVYPFINEIAKQPDKFEFHIFGNTQSGDFFERCEGIRNIYNHGPFKNPDDLNKIYSQTDLVFTAYDNRDYNVRVAIPNKLFEAIFFGVPLVVSSKTALSERVINWQVGYVVDPSDNDYAKKFIDNFKVSELEKFALNCSQFPKEELLNKRSNIADKLTAMLRNKNEL